MSLLVPADSTPRIAAPSTADAAPDLIQVEIVTDRSALAQHVAAWDDLAACALEPNAFLEPWTFLPALKAFAGDKDLLFAFLYRSTSAGKVMCGFLPLERHPRYKGLPVSLLRLWAHDQCFIGTPLLRKENARQTLQAFLEWLATDPQGASLFEFPLLPGEGPLFQLLVDEIRTRSLLTFQDCCETRALLRLRDSSEAYLKDALSGNRRRDLTRKEKRLGEAGKVSYRVLDNEADVSSWVESFLRLEAAGWKGKEGTAIACNPANATWFHEVTAAAFRRGQLHMIGLFLDGTPIALRCDFISGEGSFYFKPAYDENYSRHGPGQLLEVENIRHLHTLLGVRWMDSCTSPDNGLLNGLWLDRKILQTLVFATGQGAGRFAISLVPLLRWCKRKLGKSEPRP